LFTCYGFDVKLLVALTIAAYLPVTILGLLFYGKCAGHKCSYDLTGHHVVLLDDTWVTGGHTQGAAVRLRKAGAEYGVTTGRPRRTGWIDLPALKYAIMLNGVTQMVMTKADVLSGFDKIYACTHYNYLGEKIDYMPYDICCVEAVPVLQEIDGWNEDLTGITELSEIPAKLQAYIDYLEKELEVPIKYLSVGPDRKQTLVLH